MSTPARVAYGCEQMTIPRPLVAGGFRPSLGFAMSSGSGRDSEIVDSEKAGVTPTPAAATAAPVALRKSRRFGLIGSSRKMVLRYVMLAMYRARIPPVKNSLLPRPRLPARLPSRRSIRAKPRRASTPRASPLTRIGSPWGRALLYLTTGRKAVKKFLKSVNHTVPGEVPIPSAANRPFRRPVMCTRPVRCTACHGCWRRSSSSWVVFGRGGFSTCFGRLL